MARPEEAVRLTEIAFASKAYWGYSSEFMDACRNELLVTTNDIESGDQTFTVAETDGKIVGFYALAQVSGELFELDALFVEPEHIGSGVGRALIEQAKQEVTHCGGSKLGIQGDPNAENFYIAAGGTRAGERESASIAGRYLPLFVIDLIESTENSGGHSDV